MNLYSLTMCMSKKLESDLDEIHTFFSDRAGVYRLASLLKQQGYEVVTVRDPLGKIVDTSKALLDLPLYQASCFLDNFKYPQEEGQL